MSNEQREAQAKRLLSDTLFNESFEILKTDLMNRWNNSGSAELEARESIWLAMRLLERIHGHFKSILETGQMAKMLEKQHPFI